MDCKNCGETLKENANFCNTCGGLVVKQRIHFKRLLVEFFINLFGVDSRFFLTLRKMAVKPEEVVLEYLDGVRKRYVNPFAFLAIGAGLSLIIFNYFADDFIAIQNAVNQDQISLIQKQANQKIPSKENATEKQIEKIKVEKKIAKMQLDSMQKISEFMLRYFNLLTFVFLLIYSVLSKWTFWKPHYFGEHVIMNGYIYGFTTFFTIIAFFFAITIHPSIYMGSFIFSIIYYMYAIGRIYKLSPGKNILKFFRFLLGLVILLVFFSIVIFLIGIAIAALGLIDL